MRIFLLTLSAGLLLGAGTLQAENDHKKCRREAMEYFRQQRKACKELKGKERQECHLNANATRRGAFEACQQARKKN